MFQQELDFFKENQQNLVAQFEGKILVIKGNQVLGAYNNMIEAYKEAIKIFKPGSFMIQPCINGPEAYTVTISSSGIVKY
jgi:hypothetical protein